jgi:hypothetical protein
MIWNVGLPLWYGFSNNYGRSMKIYVNVILIAFQDGINHIAWKLAGKVDPWHVHDGEKSTMC